MTSRAHWNVVAVGILAAVAVTGCSSSTKAAPPTTTTATPASGAGAGSSASSPPGSKAACAVADLKSAISSPAVNVSPFTLTGSGCSANGQWAYADITTGTPPTKKIVVLEFNATVGVWMAANGPTVCFVKHSVPADISAKACDPSVPEVQ